jgi:hypothetical protein
MPIEPGRVRRATMVSTTDAIAEKAKSCRVEVDRIYWISSA